MDAYYNQQHMQGAGQAAGQAAGQGAGQQQQQQEYSGYSVDHMAYQHQYYQYYQYQQQQQQQQQYTSSASSALTASATVLPPSYSTPLPPSKLRQSSNNRRPQNTSNQLSQYQAQYQSSTQLGAAAASAAAVALLQFGYSGSNIVASSGSAAMTTSGTLANVVGDSSNPDEWYSNYQTPTVQQRMAVTMAMNASPHERASFGNQNGRRNIFNGQHPRQNQQQRQGRNNNSNQRGKQQHRPKPDQAKEQNAAIEGVEDRDASGFHCDACGVTFHEEAKMKIHVAAHRSCPDCQYTASPSLVSEHRKLVHSPKSDEAGGSSTPASTSASASASTSPPTASATSAPTTKPALQSNHNVIRNKRPAAQVDPGMLHPLTPVLNTPEDIAAWIAQRRKAWPTEANIQKREQERQEMIAKGQIVDEHSTKGFNNRDKRGRNNNNNNHNNKRDQRPAAIQEAYGVPTKKPKTEGAAGDGMVAYASSNEHSEEDEDVNDIMDPIKDAVTSKDPSVIGKVLLPRDKSTRPKTPCKYFLRGNCTRGDKCTFSHDPSLTNKIKKPNPVSNMKRVFRTRPSLLQMLLSGEIKEEKNRLLEAMRYIVESNFFEKQEPSGTLVEEVA